jgi:hypothetical protein
VATLCCATGYSPAQKKGNIKVIVSAHIQSTYAELVTGSVRKSHFRIKKILVIYYIFFPFTDSFCARLVRLLL